MSLYHILFVLLLFLFYTRSQVLFDGNYTCTHPNDTTCGGPGLLQCVNNVASPTFCEYAFNDTLHDGHDNLHPSCWEDSVPGNAKCVAECVQVTAKNGSIVIPAGCSYQIFNVTGPPSSISIDRPTSTSYSGSPHSTAKITGEAVARVSSASAATTERFDGVLSALGMGVAVMLL